MRKLVIIYGIITVLIVLTLVILSFVEKSSFSKDIFDYENIISTTDKSGNTVSNINNRGHVVGMDESIMLTTSKGIVEVNVINQTEKNITNQFGEFLNVYDSKIYYMDERNRILYYDTKANEIVRINSIPRYTRMSLYGDIILGYSGVNYKKCDAFDLADNKAYFIRHMDLNNNANYYDGYIYYAEYSEEDNNFFIQYDLSNKSSEKLFSIGKYDFTWTIYNNKIIYSSNEYNGKLFSLGVWEYDINTHENRQLLEGEKSYRILNIIENKLIYSDGVDLENKNWYLYDLEKGTEIKVECDGRCEAVFVANGFIIVKSTKDGIRKYMFYDEEGKYLDFEVLY